MQAYSYDLLIAASVVPVTEYSFSRLWVDQVRKSSLMGVDDSCKVNLARIDLFFQDRSNSCHSLSMFYV